MGLIAAFLSAVLSASKDLVSKQLSFTLKGSTSAFASFVFAIPFYLVLLVVLALLGLESFTLGTSFLLLVVLRSLTDSAAESCKMYSFQYGDISLVSCYLALSPLFLLFTSPLITGDQLSFTGASGVLLTVIGSLLAFPIKVPEGSRPSQIKGILFACGAAFFFSLNSCFDRLAVQRASPALSGFAMTLMAAIILMPFVKLRGRESEWNLLQAQNKLLWLRGAFEVAFMVSKLFALQFIQAPYVAGIGKIALLVSIFGGKFIFKEENFLRRIGAAGFIITGAIIIVLAEL